MNRVVQVCCCLFRELRVFLLLLACHSQVFDSAASKGSWADALGIEDQQQQQQPSPLNPGVSAAAAAATQAPAAGSVVLEPATPHADAAVQTDLSGPAESAGSTAAAGMGAPADTASDGHQGGPAHQPLHNHDHHDQHASSRQQLQAVGSDAGVGVGVDGGGAASTALLAAARHEILRLQELNRQLMQAHAEGRDAACLLARTRTQTAGAGLCSLVGRL